MPGSSKHGVMVVDDAAAGREALALFLHAHGYEVSTATDGYDALWKLKNDAVDIVVSDLEMPGLSGVQFFSLIRERFPEILVIAMTGPPGDKSEFATAKADGFYPKAEQSPKKLKALTNWSRNRWSRMRSFSYLASRRFLCFADSWRRWKVTSSSFRCCSVCSAVLSACPFSATKRW